MELVVLFGFYYVNFKKLFIQTLEVKDFFWPYLNLSHCTQGSGAGETD